MEYKLIIDESISYEELQELIAKGYRFRVFQYCISILFAVSFKRLSPAILVAPNTSFSSISEPYNWLSRIWGWWFIPYGPMDTKQSIKLNEDGGIDVTEDIMLNLNMESFNLKLVNLVKLSDSQPQPQFEGPSKSDLKAFKKALFNRNGGRQFPFEQLVVGRSLTSTGFLPVYTVGVSTKQWSSIEELTDLLYKKFLKSTTFEIVNIEIENDMIASLKSEGTLVFSQGSLLI